MCRCDSCAARQHPQRGRVEGSKRQAMWLGGGAFHAYARARRVEGKLGSRNGRVSKKAPNEPKKVRKDFRRENGSTQGGFLPRKVAFCSLSGKKQETRNKMPAASVYLLENPPPAQFFIADSVPGSIIICKGDR